VSRVTSLRPLVVAVLLAAAGGARPALAGAACAVGVPACCAADADCDDGDLCNGTETCEVGTGTCLAGTPMVCTDGNDCTVDSCIPALGLCNFPPVPDDTPCDDGDECTLTDSCQSGFCLGTALVECNDVNDCTVDTCNSVTGLCEFTPVADDTPCDDGDACTRRDTCQGGTCTGAQPIDCDDGNDCTADSCVPATGKCSNVIVPDDTPCDDGDGCTQTDVCTAGTCVGSNPLVCDDGVPCTTDACVGGVCTFTPVDAQCPDGECFDGRCAPGDADADALGCVMTPTHEGEVCTDDGVPCTDDLCASGLCVHVPIAAVCVADDPCAMATCVPGDPAADADGCVVSPGQPDGAICTEDLDPCTRDLCASGICTHQDVSDLSACDPVRDPFRQALVLAAFADELRAEIADLPGLGDSRRLGLLMQVGGIIDGLQATAAQLGGADPEADTAKARATNALGPLRRLPHDAARLVRLLTLTSKRDPVDPLEAERLHRSASDLRRGVRELKRDVRRLRRALRSFLK
jgi:hypothetical protein